MSGRLDLPSLDVCSFLITILLLALDQQIVALVVRFGIKCHEILLGFLGIELDEDATLEEFFLCTSKPDGIRGAVGGKEGFDVELSGRSLVAKALDVDTSTHGSVLEDTDVVAIKGITYSLREGDFAFNGSVVIGELEDRGGLEGVDDSGERLEMAHSFEAVDLGQFDRVILGTAD
jgi:hypothetical protein